MSTSRLLILLMLLTTVKSFCQAVPLFYKSDINLDNSNNSSTMDRNTNVCPAWFLHENKTGQCVCGDELNGVLSCDKETNRVYMIECYCMTYDDELGITTGTCFTNCILIESKISFHMFFKVPSDVNQLNEVMCGERWNRTGRLCGECKDEHYPLVYSYDMRCVNCTRADVYNWIKYVSSAFLPLTIFFVLILGFGISASSPQLEAFIIFAQVISTPANVRITLEALDSNDYPVSNFFCRLIMALYGIWNLDFFRTFLPENCLKINTLQLLALDYIIALYPLALIILTYIVVDLYDRKLFVLVWISKPFNKCLKSVDSCINIKSSILTTFISFLLFSYGRLSTVSFDLLAFTKVYSPHGKAVGTVLYYDASIHLFGHEHLPYGILALIVLFFFNIVPLMLSLIHPIKCFKGCLGKWPALRICLDSFQGCYKDGTEGTRDCRFFSSLYLTLRTVLLILYGCTRNNTFYPLASMILLLLVSLIILLKPFKPQFKVYNSIHAMLFLNLAVYSTTITIISASSLMASYITMKITCILSIISTLLPLFYIAILLFKWFYSQRLVQYYVVRYCNFCRLHKVMNGTNCTQESDVDESLPHRLENVGEDEPLHTTRNTMNYGSFQQRKSTAY